MFFCHRISDSERQRLQKLAAVREAAKSHAEQLRQEAIDEFFQSIGGTIRKVFTYINNLGK